MKSVVDLNRLLLKFLLLCHGVKGMSQSKSPWKIHFSGFKKSKIQNFLGSLQTLRFELFGG